MTVIVRYWRVSGKIIIEGAKWGRVDSGVLILTMKTCFYAKIETARSCFNNFKLQAALLTPAIGLFGLFKVLDSYRNYHQVGFTIFYSMFCGSLVCVLLAIARRGAY